MPVAMRNDAEIEKTKDQIAKERDPRKRAELQKRLSELKSQSEVKADMGGSCCGASVPKTGKR
jgi:hypothetical protein